VEFHIENLTTEEVRSSPALSPTHMTQSWRAPAPPLVPRGDNARRSVEAYNQTCVSLKHSR
jgi:hypothetical protein